MKKYLPLVVVAALVGAISSGAVQSIFSAYAVQNEIIPPTVGIFTGPQFSQKIGDGLRSVVSCNKGGSAPATVGGAAVDGLCWLDDTTSTWIKKRYVNGNWAIEGAYNSTDSTFAGVIGGGTNSINSASTTDLGSVPEANVSIAGTATIASFGSSAPKGVIKIIRFVAALTLTYSSSMPLPTGGYDLVTAANDRAVLTHLGSGVWEFTSYTRANGVPVDTSAVADAKFNFSGAVPFGYLKGDGSALTRTSYPAYTAKVTRAQNGTRTSGNATIASIANTAGFGVGMPVESTGVNAGCTIASIVANTSITLNSSSCVTASGTSTVTVFLTGYGSGGSSTTVGLPNCGGAVLAGREGTASRLSSTYFGNSTAMNTFGGAESKTLSLANLPTGITSTVSVTTATNNVGHIPLSSGAVSSLQTQGAATTNITPNNSSGTWTDTTSLAGTGSGTSTSNNTSGSAHSIMPPTLIAECIVRVTP